jgi:hypothetical protein
LPLHPAFAILIALAISSFGMKPVTQRRAWSTRAWLLFWSLCSVALAIALLWLPIRLAQNFSLSSVVAAVAAVLAVVCVWWFIARPRTVTPLVLVGLAGAGMQVVLFAAFLPTLSDLWITERAARSIARIAPTSVVAAGYSEPSLVFVVGTHTQLVDASVAAKVLNRTPHSAALIEERELPMFMQALTPGSAVERDVIQGFNYSRGKQVRLHVFAAGP